MKDIAPKHAMQTLLALVCIFLIQCGGKGVGTDDAGTSLRGTEVPTTTFTVRIENVSTPNTLVTPTGSLSVPLSPGAFAVHEQDNPLFVPDARADAGIEQIAEDGAEQTEVQELAGKDGVVESGRFDTPEGSPGRASIFSGEAYEFSIRALKGEALSFALMFVESNDLFFAPRGSGIPLFDAAGNPITGDVTDQVLLWDAGTELNEQPGTGPNQAPRQTGPNAGIAENGVVLPIAAVNDGYRHPETATVIRVSLRLAR